MGGAREFLSVRYLIGDWAGTLREFLPRVEAAGDRVAYQLALREMSVRAGGGHIRLWDTNPQRDVPRGMPVVATRLIEGKLTAIRLIDAEEASRAGVAVGDVIETIDGRSADAALAERRPVTAASTDQARDQRIASELLMGDDGSTVRIGLRGADNRLREVKLTRTKELLARRWPTKPGKHWRMLPGNIGYAAARARTAIAARAARGDGRRARTGARAHRHREVRFLGSPARARGISSVLRLG